MSTGPDRKNTHMNGSQERLDKLVQKRSREAGVDPMHYMNWLVNRVGEICEPMLKNIEAENDIPKDQQARVQFFDNNTSKTHQLVITVTRHLVEQTEVETEVETPSH